jgi:peptidoglycan hydrolase-like protein with peptidoglycan-binding domain
MNKYSSIIVLSLLVVFVFIFYRDYNFAPQQAAIAPLNTASPTVTPAALSPLSCYDFSQNLRVGMKNADVRFLQNALTKDGFSIPISSYGSYDDATRAAVKGFQEKYSINVLGPAKLKVGNGSVGKLTILKLNELYGCQAAMAQASSTPITPAPSDVQLAIKSLSMDPNGVTITGCNNSSGDIPTFPIRVRLNGINRDFDITGALKKGVCDTNAIGYDSWGLSLSSGSTITAVVIMDPNGVYKNGKLSYPANGNSNGISIPAVTGYHLAVRSILVKSSGVQGTFCNLGTIDLPTFPIRIAVNGTIRDLDVPGAYGAGKCQTTTWTFDNWGLTYSPGTTYSVSATTDPGNIYREISELDNVASVIGIP